jgi:hypothetical protein
MPPIPNYTKHSANQPKPFAGALSGAFSATLAVRLGGIVEPENDYSK